MGRPTWKVCFEMLPAGADPLSMRLQGGVGFDSGRMFLTPMDPRTQADADDDADDDAEVGGGSGAASSSAAASEDSS